MKLFWWSAPHPEGKNNYGDMLAPLIFDYFGIKYTYSYTDYNVISVGSIANYAKEETIVLGSGILDDQIDLNPKADWRFVRGPYTRINVLRNGGKCPEIYGDPGALLSLIIKPEEKQHEIGIMPHYADREYVLHSLKEHKLNWKFVDPLSNDAVKTTKEITSCKVLYSSCLHGIICAHSYDIPTAWVKFSDALPGDSIKFKDYFWTIGLKANPSSVTKPVLTTGKVNVKPIIKIFESLK